MASFYNKLWLVNVLPTICIQLLLLFADIAFFTTPAGIIICCCLVLWLIITNIIVLMREKRKKEQIAKIVIMRGDLQESLLESESIIYS